MKKLAAWFISKFEGDKGFSGGEIKFLIIIFLVMLTALTILYVFYGLSLSSRFDFLSYLMPCLAGILAGAGLFFGYERRYLIRMRLGVKAKTCLSRRERSQVERLNQR